MADDPFNRPDVTRLRPRPGAGKRGGGTDVFRPPSSAPWIAEAPPIPEADRANLGIGLSRLVRAASPLLLLAGQLRSTLSQLDIAGLRRQALDEIRRFEEHARSSGIQSEIVVMARYALCAALDEAVLSTPWGRDSEWAQHPLLVDLHREAWGGEKFFEMLDRLSNDPSRYLELMELQYLCIAFGFGGKYQIMERGPERLGEVQRNLYRKIHAERGVPEPELSLRWRGLEDRRNPLVRYVPWWVVGAATLAILTIVYTFYYAGLASWASPVQTSLAKVGLEDFSPLAAPPPPPQAPTLKRLLAPEEARGALTVEEQGARTVVTLIARDLFASGSADVNQAYGATLKNVAKALNQVAGSVTVVGHTDDQPLRSLRYQNNFALSRERAVNVINILGQTIDNRARLFPNGVGDSQPRYTPASDPQNRARNRRVEIIHVRG
jgi:type VI secretion system protein ImpK